MNKRLAGTEQVEEIGRVKLRRWHAIDPVRLVVLVHGYTEHVGRYGALAQALTARGSLVVGPDHIGHGLSPGERGVMDDFEKVVDDLHEVVRATRGDHPVVMVGHSMGGLIAMRYAQRYAKELAGLVLSAPAVGLGPFLESVLAAPEIPEQGFDGSLLSRDPTVGDENAKDPLVWHGPWRRATLEAALATNKAVEVGPDFGDLPVLYLHGAEDWIIAVEHARPIVERLARADSEVHILPEQRHEIFNEIGKEETFAMIADFAEHVTRAK